MLKEKILATNTIFLTTEHSLNHINKYIKVLDKIFKQISHIEKNKLNIDNFLEGPVSHSTFKRLN